MYLFSTEKEISGGTSAICTDEHELGLCPKLYYTADGQVIANDPISVASTVDQGLDSLALIEEMALSFELGRRTLFQSVNRLLPWERLSYENGRVQIHDIALADVPESISESLSNQVESAFEDGAALELTSGLDSRLLLAAGLHRGVVPKFSFTIGDMNSHEVSVAAAIAERYKFRHLTLPLVINSDRIKDDAMDFVRASGYAVNAASYAWLPATLAVLDSERNSQMSGLVGELAGSFYYTPFDSLIDPLRLSKLWVKYRLIRPGVGWETVWNPGMCRALEQQLIEEATQAVNRFEGSWRERTDLFYKNERTRRWALAVLDASNNYYKVVAPLLSADFCAWAAALPVKKRPNREPLRQLLRSMDPELANFKLPGKLPKKTAIKDTMGRIGRRLRRKKSHSSLGTIKTAIALSQNAEMADMVRELAQGGDLGLSEESVEKLLNTPEDHPEVFGVLVTAAIAWHDLRQAAAEKFAR